MSSESPPVQDPAHRTPESPASERNKRPILEVIRPAFAKARHVLEIGSGTGQHAVFFARALPYLLWQPSERAEWLPALRARIAQEGSENLAAPIELDVAMLPWPIARADTIFSANTLHIMAWHEVQSFFAGVGHRTLAVYGPFKYRGAFTTPSNAAFDESLKSRDPASGIRDFEAVDALARAQGLVLSADHAMPANNQLLVWVPA